MGNTNPISYGGFQLGIALNAASHTANAAHYLYSATGYYLAPVSTEDKVTCTVEEIRSTRTFSTRIVRVEQNGRLCLVVTADFRSAEQALLEFNTPPSRKYTFWSECKGIEELKDQALKDGTISEEQARVHDFFFGSGLQFWENRPAPEGVMGQNLNGVVKEVKTTQDGLTLSEKTSADWYRVQRKLEKGGGEQMAALGFLSDAALSFLPLVHNGMFLDDGGACSSLDFSLRLFSNSIDLNEWHLVERRALCGSLGLTHTVANIFDAKGQLVAQMSQQSILRRKTVKLEKGKL